MAFLSLEEEAKLSPYEKSEYWLSLLTGGEKVALLVEGIFLFMFGVFYSMEIIGSITSPVLWHIAFVISLILVLMLVIFLITVQSVLFYEFVNALGTETKKDDLMKGALVFIITICIFFADIYGSKKYLNKYNAYTPAISSIDTDSRVKSNNTDRAKIEKERAEKDKSLICTKCKTIESEYNLKISKQRSNLRKNEKEAKWKQVENNKIRSIVNSLEEEKKSAIAIAEADFIESKNKTLATFDARLLSIDTMQVRVKSSIDSSNSIELGKVTEREKNNERKSGGLTFLTQLVLFGCRFRKVKIYKKRGMSYSSIGKFMKSGDLLIIPIQYIEMHLNVISEKMQVNQKINTAKKVIEVDEYKKRLINGDAVLQHVVENGIKDYASIKAAMQVLSKPNDIVIDDISEEKSVKKSAENIENTDEKQVILEMIAGYKAALPFADDDTERTYLQEMIGGYESALIIIQL